MVNHRLVLSLCLGLAPACGLRADDYPVIDLWPEGVPGLRADASAERVLDGGRITNVHRPTLTVIAPSNPATDGTAVIICPGGGYTRLAFDHEGIVPAKWFRSLGVTAFILKYRLREYGHPAPLRDVLRAVRTVRSRAAEYHIRPDRIGVLGFSAGGHLAASSGTLFDSPDGRTGAPIDAVSGRPDFILLIYPVITMDSQHSHQGSLTALLGQNPQPELARRLSVETQVSKATPPAFIVQTEEDKTVDVENSLMFYQALRNADVPAELHLYAKGPHGFGMRPGFGPASDWPARAESWMRFNGWLP